MSRLRIDQLPARYQNQVAAQIDGQLKAALVPTLAPAKPILRQHDGDGMNRTERAFLAWLKETYPAAYVHREVSLPLANGVRYKIDFLSVHTTGLGATVTGWEVKGFMRDDAAVKIKVAADVYRWITFKLVRRVKGGGWEFQNIHA